MFHRASPRASLLLVASVVFASCAVFGCGSSAPPPAAPTTGAPTSAPTTAATVAAPASSGVVAPGEAKIGDKSFCLVSKEEFVVDASSPKAVYEGKTYYFCCPGCAGKFEKDPGKYLKP